MKQKINRLEDKLFELDSSIENLHSTKISDMPRGGVPQTLDDLLIRREELESRINRLLEKNRENRVEICNHLDTLEDDLQAEILEEFFINGKSLEEIAQTERYSLRWISKNYSEGVRNLKLD